MIEITSEALNSIRLRCEARMPFQSSEVLSLIAEVERLRAELNAVDQALGGTPTIVLANTTRSDSIRELGREVERLSDLMRQKP